MSTLNTYLPHYCDCILTRWLRRIFILLFAPLLTTSCVQDHYDNYEPSPLKRAQNEARYDAGELSAGALADQNQYVVSYKISDKDVVDFSDDMTHLLRKQISYARLARYSSATFQIMAASAASALAAAGGPTTVVAGLAGGAALMPSLQKIFKASDKANIFEDGAKNIEIAKIAYLKTLPDSGLVPSDRFTPDAARLYEATFANIAIVDQRINDLLPTVAEIQAAQGNINEIAVQPSSLTLVLGTQATGHFVAMNNKKVYASSVNTAVATATVSGTDTDQGTVSPVALGTTQIVITNDSGQTGYITVNVVAPYLSLSSSQATLHPSKTFQVSILESIDSGKTPAVQSSDPEIVQATVSGNLVTFTGGSKLGVTQVVISYQTKSSAVTVTNSAIAEDLSTPPPMLPAVVSSGPQKATHSGQK